MSAAVESDPAVDTHVAGLGRILAELGAAVTDGTPMTAATRIERMATLEKIRAATASLQLVEIVRFGQQQVADRLAQDLHPRHIGAGVADQIALACRVSASHGARRLAVARALLFDLPETYAALTAGRLSERVAEIVVEETRHLDQERRRLVDARLIAAGITDLGLRAAANCAKRYAYEADRQGYLDRSKASAKQRRVTLRPGPDSMTFLTSHLPLVQGVSCLTALRQAADSARAAGDPRTQGQIMADTLVERVTGQATAEDVNVEVQILLPAELLSDPDSQRSAVVQGYGAIPGPLARDIVDRSRGRKRTRDVRAQQAGAAPNPTTGPPVSRLEARLTELFGLRPSTGWQIVGIDSRRRRFTGPLADLIKVRDQHCRMPYCDAPIRHLDHIIEHHRGGQTTLANGQGLCERHNYLRNVPGWRTDLVHPGSRGPAHETVVTTPTGHRYHSRAPDPP